MKNRTKILSLLCFILTASQAISQNCPTRNLSLSKQAEIDNFAATYPGCTQLPVSLSIRGAAITNLNGLSVLSSVAGLDISGTSNLTNLAGLDNIRTIEGNLNINNCAKLTSLGALSKLESITGGEITISANPLLPNLSGLSMLSTFSPNTNLTITNNKQLGDLSGLSGIGDFPGNISISLNQGLINLSGLSSLKTVGGYFLIEKNYKLTDLTGLSELESVGGHFTLNYDTSLTNVAALSSLQTVGLSQGGNLYIVGSKKLTNLNGLEGLSAVNGLQLGDNAKLINIRALDHPISIGNLGINIDYNVQLSDCAVRAVCDYLYSFSNCPQISIGIQNNNTCCRSCDEVRSVCSGQCCAPKVSIKGEHCITTATTVLTADAGKGNFTYLWNTNPPQTTQKVTVGTGTYCVTVTDASSGCTASACFTVCRPPTIAFSPSGTITLCKGDCITLKAFSGSNVSFLWSDGETKSVREVCPTAASTTFVVTVKNEANCSSTGSVILKTVSCLNANGCESAN